MRAGSDRSSAVMASSILRSRRRKTSGSSPSGIISAVPGMRAIMSFMPVFWTCSSCLRKSLSVKSWSMLHLTNRATAATISPGIGPLEPDRAILRVHDADDLVGEEEVPSRVRCLRRADVRGDVGDRVVEVIAPGDVVYPHDQARRQRHVQRLAGAALQ